MSANQSQQTISHTPHGKLIRGIPNAFARDLTKDVKTVVIEGRRSGLDKLWMSVYKGSIDRPNISNQSLSQILLDREAVDALQVEIDDLRRVWAEQDAAAAQLDKRIETLRRDRDHLNEEIASLRRQRWSLKGSPRE